MEKRFDEVSILEVVQERPDPTLDWNNPCCPNCSGTNLKHDGDIASMIGWFPAKPEDNRPDCSGNPNHTSKMFFCRTCRLPFSYGVSYGNICVTTAFRTGNPRGILKGIPTEVSTTVKYTCSRCSGLVLAERYDLPRQVVVAPDEPTTGWTLTCKECGRVVTIPHSKGIIKTKPYKNSWHYVDEKGPILLKDIPGSTVVNSKALEKGEVP